MGGCFACTILCASDPLTYNCRQLQATMWVLGTKPRFSGGTVYALNHRDIAPAPHSISKKLLNPSDANETCGIGFSFLASTKCPCS